MNIENKYLILDQHFDRGGLQMYVESEPWLVVWWLGKDDNR